VAQQKPTEADDLAEVAREQVGVYEFEKAKLNAAEREHSLVKNCPICPVPVTRPNSEECGILGVNTDVDDLALAMQEADYRAEQLKTHVWELSASERSRKNEAEAAKAVERTHLKAFRDRPYALRRWGDEIDHLAALVEEDARANDDVRTCVRETGAARRRQVEAREEAAKRHVRLCDLCS